MPRRPGLSSCLQIRRVERVGGPSAFIVPAGIPGIEVGNQVGKMGARGAPSSEVVLKNCCVPEENLLGREGQGRDIAAAAIDSSRIGIAALALGIAAAALEESVRYSKERVQFGQADLQFPGNPVDARQYGDRNRGLQIFDILRCLVLRSRSPYREGSRNCKTHGHRNGGAAVRQGRANSRWHGHHKGAKSRASLS